MREMTIQKKRNKIPGISWILMWFLTGLVIALMVLGMSMSGSHSLTNSLQFGEVRDIRDVANIPVAVGENNKNNVGYSESRGVGISLMGDGWKWNYLYLYIDSMDADSIQCKLTFQTDDGTVAYTMLAAMEKGMNRIALPGIKFSGILIEIEQPETCSLNIANVQVREKDKIEVSEKDILSAFTAFAIYSLISFALYVVVKRKKTNLYAPIEILQKVYIAVADAFLWVPKRFSARVRTRLRTLLLMFWMAYTMMAANYGFYQGIKYYKYNLVICLIIVFLIAILLIEKKLEQVLWKKQIVFCWFITSVLMCMSEFFFAKRFTMTGYAFLLLFGFLYLIWNNMVDQKIFLGDIMRALRGLLYLAVVYCLIFRTYHEIGGYAGPTWNPNVFAMFLTPVLIAELTELAKAVRRKEKGKILLLLLEISVCVVCNLLADSRIGLLTMGIGFVIFFLYLVRIHSEKNAWKRVLVLFALLVVLIIPMYGALKWGFTNLPPNIGREVVYPSDDLKFSEDGVLLVQAAEEESIVEKIVYAPEVTKVLSKRNLYWTGYIREMNFLGHDFAPRIWGAKRTSHNGILASSYVYGVLIAVPYLFLYLNGIWESFRKMYHNSKGEMASFFVFGSMVVIFGFMMVENVERPFLATEWILLYLLLGILFPSEETGICKKEVADGKIPSGLSHRTGV